MCRRTPSLGRPEVLLIAFLAKCVQRLICRRSGQGLADPENPHTSLLGQRRSLTDWAQGDLFACRFEIQLVARLKTELIAIALRDDYATGAVERTTGVHAVSVHWLDA